MVTYTEAEVEVEATVQAELLLLMSPPSNSFIFALLYVFQNLRVSDTNLRDLLCALVSCTEAGRQKSASHPATSTAGCTTARVKFESSSRSGHSGWRVEQTIIRSTKVHGTEKERLKAGSSLEAFLNGDAVE